MSDITHEVSQEVPQGDSPQKDDGLLKGRGAFRMALAWLAALAASIAGLIGLS